MTKRKIARTSTSLLIAAAAFILALLVSVLEISQMLELKTLDARFRLRGKIDVSDSGITIVGIDDRSYDELPGRMPFPREYYAHLIRNLNRAGAKLIVFDIQFDKPEVGDSALAAAIAQAGNVILCGKVLEERHPFLKQPITHVFPPNELLLDTGVDWGIVNEPTDPDGFTRRYIIFQPIGQHTYLPIGLKAAARLKGFSGAEDFNQEKGFIHYCGIRIPLTDANTMLVNFCGPARTFPTFSLSDVLDDADFELRKNDTDYMDSFLGNSNLPKEFAELLQNPFKGRVVLVGATIEELKDTFLSPFYSYGGLKEKTAGVEYHANALWTILNEAYIRTQSVWQIWLGMFLAAALTALAVHYLKPLGGLAALGLELILIAALSVFLFNRWGFWLEVTGLSLAATFAYAGTGGFQFISEQKEKRMIKGMFQHYLAKSLVDELIANPDKLKLGGEKKELTVFFSDIEGFTTISENLPPETLLEYLNEYLTVMTEIVLENDGMLDKYIGDAIVAVWGAPIIREDHALLACRAALKMQNSLRELREFWRKQGKPQFRTRIGMGTGAMTIGNVGSKHRLSYTVVGDVVNLASRLEAINKVYRTEILISENTYNKVAAHFHARELDLITVKGKSEPARIYQLLEEAEKALSEKQSEINRLYSEGISFYRVRDWEKAAEKFQACLRIDGGDYPSTLHLERCAHFQKAPPPPDWNGVWVYEVK